MTATCPYCRAPFEPEEETLPCAVCATVHHADCWSENRGCTVFGCAASPVEEPKISVSNHDLSSPQSPPPADAATPVPPLGRTPAPPPPRPPGWVPPAATPQIHTNYPPQARPLAFAGYAPPPNAPQISLGYVSRKNRVAFVLLAIFFGSFGVHNFYAGYIKKGVIQCCLTVFTFFMASPLIWVWAIVEACIINADDDGVTFT